ncbi:MAG: hypothetical protein ACJARD_001055 [Alphaproteobacteria bacterium]|jgi:hypothetical protein
MLHYLFKKVKYKKYNYIYAFTRLDVPKYWARNSANTRHCEA